METVIETADCERVVRPERIVLSDEAARVRAIRRLVIEAAETAAHPNWDGEGAAPLVPELVGHAERVADWIVAHDLPLPEVEPDPDGRICFVWEPEQGRIAAIDVKTDGTMLFTCYDGRIGKNEYGRLEGPVPPDALAEGIRSIHEE